MKKFIVVFLLCFGLCGFAELQAMQNDRKTEISNYFIDPRDKLMIKVEAIGKTGIGQVQCTFSSGSITDMGSNNNSFKAYTPFVRVFNCTVPLKKLRASFKSLPIWDKNRAKAELLASAPCIVFTCQSTGYGGIDGKIYFNGKQVASDVANVPYGIISLSYSLTIDDILTDK